MPIGYKNSISTLWLIVFSRQVFSEVFLTLLHHSDDCFIKREHGNYTCDTTRKTTPMLLPTPNKPYPEQLVAPYTIKYDCRTKHKNCAHHHEQQHGKHKHHLFAALSEIVAHQFRQVGTSMSHTQHSAQIIVDRSGKHTAKHNPKVGLKTMPSSHDGSEDRSGAGDIEELYHEHLTTGEHDEVHSVGFDDSGRRLIVAAKKVFNNPAINKIAHNQSQKAQRK